MHFNPRDPFSRHHTRRVQNLGRFSPRLRLLLALATILVISMTPVTFLPIDRRWPLSCVHALAALSLAVVVVRSRIALRYLAVRLGLLLPVLLLPLVALPFARGPQSAWFLAGGILAKSMLSLTTMLVLVQSVSWEQLVQALRQLHVPALLVDTLAFACRYRLVLEEELGRMRRARAARTFRPQGLAGLGTAAGLIGMLLVAAVLERAQRVRAAMLARGYDGTDRPWPSVESSR